MEFEYPPGATPIEPDEAEGLLLPHITNRAQLDRWEQENILEAEKWAFRRKPKDLLSIDYTLRLHAKMFGMVWSWAGSFRSSGKNIGVEAWSIRSSLTDLLEDVKVWIEHQTYGPDEIAARFHHRLVAIHPFANGNGRHARLMTDVMVVFVFDRRRFSWGSENLTGVGECRSKYISALREADRQQYGRLLEFVRS